MPHNITKELKENMSTFKTKTIALMASSLIVAVAGLSFATTPAFAKHKKNGGNQGIYLVTATKSPDSKPAAAHRDGKAATSKPAANKKK